MTMQQIGAVATKIVDRWAWWRQALANPSAIGKALPVHENDVMQGYYRTKNRAGGYDPVAIWYDEDDNLLAYRAGREVDAHEVWTFVCRQPVTYEAYQAAVETGRWPDDDPVVAAQVAPPVPGHNSGDVDDLEIMRDQIDAAKAGAKAYAKIADDETLTKAQSLRSRLNELSGEADKKRDALKRPHLEAGRKIDGDWQPLVKGAKEAADGIRKAMEAYETEKLRKRREAERAAEEARRKAEEEARKAAEPNTVTADVSVIHVPDPAPAPAPTQIKGSYGKAASTGIKNVVTSVTDWDALWGFLREHPEVKELFQKLAQRAVDRNFTVPGVRVEEQATVR